MAYVNINASGCCDDRGMVQIRYSMYLDKDDYGYEKMHFINEDNTEIDCSFHNHFIQAPPDITEQEIMDIGEAFLHEAYIKWAQELPLDLKNNDLPFERKEHNIDLVAKKVESVKKITAVRKTK